MPHGRVGRAGSTWACRAPEGQTPRVHAYQARSLYRMPSLDDAGSATMRPEAEPAPRSRRRSHAQVLKAGQDCLEARRQRIMRGHTAAAAPIEAGRREARGRASDRLEIPSCPQPTRTRTRACACMLPPHVLWPANWPDAEIGCASCRLRHHRGAQWQQSGRTCRPPATSADTPPHPRRRPGPPCHAMFACDAPKTARLHR